MGCCATCCAKGRDPPLHCYGHKDLTCQSVAVSLYLSVHFFTLGPLFLYCMSVCLTDSLSLFVISPLTLISVPISILHTLCSFPPITFDYADNSMKFHLVSRNQKPPCCSFHVSVLLQDNSRGSYQTNKGLCPKHPAESLTGHRTYV